MVISKEQISVRRFRETDAHFCFQIRADAFQKLFINEIGEEAAVAGINAYQPSDFIRFARDTEIFIVEVEGQSAGFFIIRRMTPQIAELVLIYLDSRFISLGLGKYCCLYLERWIAEHWKEVVEIYVDTVIPKYNGMFYERLGYQRSETVSCRFPGLTIAAVRFVKNIDDQRCCEANYQ